jgi:hypothetical protein
MPGIFISYRREDSAGYAGRICAWLKAQIAEDQVFMDIDGIAPGEDYIDVIHKRITSSQLVLVIIGPQWTNVKDSEGRRRLEQADDLVCIEIATALSLGVRVIPVLVAGAVIPPQKDLPEPLGGLTRLNALIINDRFFDQGMEYLGEHLRKWGFAFRETDRPETSEEKPLPSGRGKSKVCLLGAAGVGKTSLISRFVRSLFSDSYLTTVAVKIDKKVVSLGASEVTLMIWDIAGEEEGYPLKLEYARDSSGIILVADGCRLSTLDTAMNLRRRIYDYSGPIPTILAVNKVDIQDEWQVPIESLEGYGRIGLTTFTTSAKTGKAVDQLFTHLARTIAGARS